MRGADESCIGVIGARSMVGRRLLARLSADGQTVLAFSRAAGEQAALAGVRWYPLSKPPEDCMIERWVVLAPIWTLPDYLPLLTRSGARRVVALSSTSRFSKQTSPLAAERDLASRLAEGERYLAQWAEAGGVDWVLFRPTLIYGYGEDQNVVQIARIVRRTRLFPLFGRALGLRQPVHVEDIAAACCAALHAPQVSNRAYALSGGETLSYRAMVSRISLASGVRPRYLRIPLALWRALLPVLRPLPRYRQLNSAMALRMNQDLVYDHSDAARDFGFYPRGFRPQACDVGRAAEPASPSR